MPTKVKSPGGRSCRTHRLWTERKVPRREARTRSVTWPVADQLEERKTVLKRQLEKRQSRQGLCSEGVKSVERILD